MAGFIFILAKLYLQLRNHFSTKKELSWEAVSTTYKTKPIITKLLLRTEEYTT